MKDITAEQWSEEVQEGALVLVDIWAEWCQPCKMMLPVFEKLEAEMPTVKVVKVDADDTANAIILDEFNVTSIPTMILFKDGERVWTMTGAKPLGVLTEKLAPYVE
jgi:thioredoxin